MGAAVEWEISQYNGQPGYNFRKTNPLSALEQIVALNVYRIGDLEIVFDILTAFPAHCTCCLGKKSEVVAPCPDNCLSLIDEFISKNFKDEVTNIIGDDLPGPAGPPGDKGVKGTNGINGVNGANGKPGQAGPAGGLGEAGETGDKGQAGTDGQAGA